MKSILAESAAGLQRLHQNQPVIILTAVAGETINGIILAPARKTSLVRYSENGTLRERRVKNERLVPANGPEARVKT